MVFSGYSGFRHDITEILFKVALNTINQRYKYEWEHDTNFNCYYRRESLMKQASLESTVPHQLVRQMSVHDVECQKSFLCPKVEGRIFHYDDEVCYLINLIFF